MICLIKREYETNVCHFAVDTISELDLLPKVNTKGKDVLKTIAGCSMGSTAVVTENSEKYILNGEQNTWVKIADSSEKYGVTVLGVGDSSEEIIFGTEASNV